MAGVTDTIPEKRIPERCPSAVKIGRKFGFLPLRSRRQETVDSNWEAKFAYVSIAVPFFHKAYPVTHGHTAIVSFRSKERSAH